jgi:hypothetical protein
MNVYDIPASFESIMTAMDNKTEIRLMLVNARYQVVDLPTGKKLCEYVRTIPELFLLYPLSALITSYNGTVRPKTIPIMSYLSWCKPSLVTKFLDGSSVVEFLLPSISDLIFTTRGMVAIAKQQLVQRDENNHEVGVFLLRYIKKGVATALLMGLHSPESLVYNLSPHIIRFIVELYMDSKTTRVF